MANQVKIFRPKKVTAEIFGEKHELHRLTRGDVIDLASLFVEVQPDLTNLTLANVKKILLTGKELFGTFMSVSFPSFTGWDELAIIDEMSLFELAWEENDVAGIFANFTRMGERIAKKPLTPGQ